MPTGGTMDNRDAVPIKIPDWSGLVGERDRLAAELATARAEVEKMRAVVEAAEGYRREYGRRGPIVAAAVIDRMFTALDALPARGAAAEQ